DHVQSLQKLYGEIVKFENTLQKEASLHNDMKDRNGESKENVKGKKVANRNTVRR
ncbi:hypothetical protein SNEBB_002944, partial [Seison nebaliae]